jgi:hypothetical protein
MTERSAREVEAKNQRQEELLEIARALERLALEIRDAALEDDVCMDRPCRETRSPEIKTVAVGQRVRVTIEDQYLHRIGTIVNKRGKQYWYIRLDPLDGEVAQVIFKKATSFVMIDDK